MKTQLRVCLALLCALGASVPVARAQEVVNPRCNLSQETPLAELVRQSTLAVEGRVETQRSFWNDKHTAIYTATTVTVYKVFKGQLVGDKVEIVTPGGTVGDQWEEHHDDPAVLRLSTGIVGLFLGVPTRQGTQGSALPAGQVLDVVGRYEGFFRYSGEQPEPTAAFSACRRYRNIPVTLYRPVEEAAGQPYRVVHEFDLTKYDPYALPAAAPESRGATPSNSPTKAVSPQKKSTNTSPQSAGQPAQIAPTAVPSISGLSASQVTAGTFTNLTITGNNFQDLLDPSVAPVVRFSNVERLADPQASQYIPAPAENIVSWTNTQIVVRVPSNFQRTVGGVSYSGCAGTGPIVVQTRDGVSSPSATLTIVRAETTFDSPSLSGSLQAYRQMRLTGRDGGGYQLRYGSTLFNTPQAVRAVQYALQQWRCSTNVNIGDNITAAVPYDPAAPRDLVCNIEFVDQTGPLAAAMATRSGGNICSQNGAHYAFRQYFDIEIDLDQDRRWNYDLTYPAAADQMDFVSALMHELGHCAVLQHVADNTKMMFPVLNPGETERTLSAEPEINGVTNVLSRSTTQYTCSQGFAYFPMQPLSSSTCQGGQPSINMSDVIVDRCTMTPATVTLTASGGGSYVWVSKEHFNNTNPTTSTVTATTAPYTPIGVYTSRNGLGGTALVNVYIAENVWCPPGGGGSPSGSTFRTSAYPNPSTGDFTVDYQPPSTTRPVDVELVLHNGQGTVLQTFRFPGNSQRRQIPVRGLARGIYFLRTVENGQTGTTLRLQVQ